MLWSRTVAFRNDYYGIRRSLGTRSHERVVKPACQHGGVGLGIISGLDTSGPIQLLNTTSQIRPRCVTQPGPTSSFYLNTSSTYTKNRQRLSRREHATAQTSRTGPSRDLAIHHCTPNITIQFQTIRSSPKCFTACPQKSFL
jgi:hypothetical protein